MKHILQYYHERAQAAYAAAEAADDPRDKAAYRGAAQTWERLSKPSLQSTFSLELYREQIAALKKDVEEVVDSGASFLATCAAVEASATQAEDLSKRAATDHDAHENAYASRNLRAGTPSQRQDLRDAWNEYSTIEF